MHRTALVAALIQYEINGRTIIDAQLDNPTHPQKVMLEVSEGGEVKKYVHEFEEWNTPEQRLEAWDHWLAYKAIPRVSRKSNSN